MTWSARAKREGEADGALGRRRAFRVFVDGVPYVVEVEELAGLEPSLPWTRDLVPIPGAVPERPAPPPPLPAGAPQPGDLPATPRPAAGDGTVQAPMPGVVVSVSAMPGQRVRKGDLLMVLSAMKLENEVRAPRDGVVQAVFVQAGQTVMAGNALATIVPEAAPGRETAVGGLGGVVDRGAGGE